MTRDVRVLFDVLRPAGGAFIVGGAVRDTLMGGAPKDIDLCTSADPHEVTRMLADAGIRSVPTGIDYGVITAVVDGNPYEITTFRRDVECDGRRAVTVWGASLEEDAQRRDLTFNALYADEGGRVIDPTGGLDDLAVRRVRFVGDAVTRIREDRLRAFRMFRFWSRFGDPDPAMHEEAIAACRKFAGDFSAVSRERIGAEMFALLKTDDPRPQIREMGSSGIWRDACGDADHGAVIAVIEAEMEHGTRSFTARLSPIPPETLKVMLKAPNEVVKAVIAANQGAKNADPAVTAFTLGERAARDSLILRAASGEAAMSRDEEENRIRHGTEASFPVFSSDISWASGKELGDALRQARSSWLDGGMIASKDELLDAIRPDTERRFEP